MKLIQSLLFSIAVCTAAASCGNATSTIAGIQLGGNSFVSSPDSKTVTRTQAIGNVASLSTSAGLNVTYVVSNENKVIIQAPEDIQDKITISDNGNSLNLGVSRNIRNIYSLAKITVMSPAINSFHASSGSSITLPAAFSPRGGELELDASSGASIQGQNINASVIGAESSSGASLNISVTAGSIACSSSSGASLTVSGTAKAVSLQASSGASLNARKLKAASGNASASSGASVSCSIAKPTKISKSSGGSVSNH